MTRKPHPDWEPFCPDCVMKKVCDEWDAHPMECDEPMPEWVRKAQMDSNKATVEAKE